MKYPGQAMPDQNKASRELLDPVSRISEILFGLLMALTFTTTFNAATTGQESVRTMFFAALGCNLAWGLVDAMIFLVQTLTERGYRSDLLRRVRTATEPAQAHRMIADSMPLLATNLTVADFEALRVRLRQLPESAVRARLSPSDFLAALAVFLLVVLATFPVVIPFLIMADLALAMRVLQRHRHHHDVLRRLGTGPLRRIPSAVDRPLDARAGCHPGRGDDCAWWMRRIRAGLRLPD